MTAKESTPSAYPKCEQLDNRDLHSTTPLLDANGFRNITRSQSNMKHQTQTASTEPPVISKQPPEVSQAQSPQEYVIDQIVSHRVNDDQEHPSAKLDEPTYRVQRYGFDSNGDTFEPIRHTLRNKIVSYYNASNSRYWTISKKLNRVKHDLLQHAVELVQKKTRRTHTHIHTNIHRR